MKRSQISPGMKAYLMAEARAAAPVVPKEPVALAELALVKVEGAERTEPPTYATVGPPPLRSAPGAPGGRVAQSGSRRL